MTRKPTPAEVVALYRKAVEAHHKIGAKICQTCESHHSLGLSEECLDCAIGCKVNYKERES